MARRDDLIDFAKLHNLKIVTVADIIEYRLRNETMVQRIAEAKLPTAFGEFTAIVFRTLVDFTEHLALVMGDIDPSRPILVRAHREYLPGDVFGLSQRNTRKLLRAAMEKIAAAGEGVLLYVKREANTIAAELDALNAQGARQPTTRVNAPDAEFRDYGIGAQIIRDLGVRKMIVLSDTPPRLANLPGYGLEIVGSVPLSDDLTSAHSNGK
jgi:3,4-dihydroxy 2-butanone 4-phosphate synthase/GTP cyclohydrolase II